MSLQEKLLDLETAANQISNGVNALQVMSMGLRNCLDPYAGGFDVLCGYMVDADRELQTLVSACLDAICT